MSTFRVAGGGRTCTAVFHAVCICVPLDFAAPFSSWGIWHHILIYIIYHILRYTRTGLDSPESVCCKAMVHLSAKHARRGSHVSRPGAGGSMTWPHTQTIILDWYCCFYHIIIYILYNYNYIYIYLLPQEHAFFWVTQNLPHITRITVFLKKNTVFWKP